MTRSSAAADRAPERSGSTTKQCCASRRIHQNLDRAEETATRDVAIEVGFYAQRAGDESPARGMGTGTTHGEQHLRAAAQFADGQWKVLILRALDTGGDEDLALPVGQPIPMAFQVWDGDNGESGNQGAVSTWYFLFLHQQTPVAVYVAPPVALALTLLLGVFVVRRAQGSAEEEAREGEGAGDGAGDAGHSEEKDTSTEDGDIR